jgi:hypothetical protein
MVSDAAVGHGRLAEGSRFMREPPPIDFPTALGAANLPRAMSARWPRSLEKPNFHG